MEIAFRCPRRMVVAVIGALLISGCGGKEIPIHGIITLDGEPVPGPGTIAFYAESGTDSPHASAEFKDGKYEIPAEQGPHAGRFRVEITWPKPTGKQIPSADPGMLTDERVEAIPEKYNKNTELKAEISSSQTVHDFHLKSR
jgi:hypothetical protein